MNRAILALLFSASVSFAGFSDDQYAESPDIIARIAAAAQKHGKPLHSSADGTTSYYLRSAEYVGPCDAPFGTVHVARLFFIRSAPRGSKAPARGHTFIAFLDRDFAIRTFWTVDFTLGRLSLRDSKLLLDDKELFDYAKLPASGTVAADGSIHSIPQWQ